ncbi:hypothetical protein FHT76_008155 [Rhizobium sp. BK176]|nr:hypothetical protein [Rhizobium sp. BK176]
MEARDFITKSLVPLAGHLAANGWIAVTSRDTYAEQDAKDVAKALKSHGLSPRIPVTLRPRGLLGLAA